MITIDYLLQSDGLHIELMDIGTGLTKSWLIVTHTASPDVKFIMQGVQAAIDSLSKDVLELIKKRSKL